MIRLLTTVLPLFLAMNSTHAEVFRCETENGVVFSDQACGDNAVTVPIRDNRIGGSLDQNLPPSTPTEPSDQAEEEQQEQATTCRFINSTDLRRHIVREEVVRGMTREHVRRAFGNPPETYTSPQEVWIYQTRYYGALYELTYVYFMDGCVERVVYRKP